ncbi:MAG: ABC transporter substrate-binding protein, partial [Sphingobacteriales bacterium]
MGTGLSAFKTIIVALSLVLWLLLSGSCYNPESKAASTFFINYSAGTIESIDPAFARNLYNMWTDHMIYNTLVETNSQLSLVPSLATRWDVSEDGLYYTFHLRNDVYFHDNELFPQGQGRKMTAHDVAFSFNRLIDPAVASSGAWIFNGKVRETDPFVAEDDSTISIHLKVPFRPLPEILSMPYCSIVPKEVVAYWGKDFSQHPCGTGPFVFNYWDEGNVLVLKKNRKYWERDLRGERLPYLDAVQISFVDSKATEFFLFLQGKIDFVNSIDGSFKDLVLTKTGELKNEYSNRINLQKNVYLNTEYIGFLIDTTNDLLKASPLRNPLVRKAINFAIDKTKIVRYFKNGIGIPAEQGFIPKGMLGFDSTSSFGYSYNPAKSLELLKQAGHPKGKGLGVITVLTPDNWADIVNFIAAQVQDVGIKMKVEIIQPNILRQQMSKSEAHAFRAQWIADYPDAETFLAFFNSRFPAPPNYTRFSNPYFDKLYDLSMNAPDSIRALY